MKINKVKGKKITLFIIRISMGWMFLYAGITKILDSSWSAQFYLKSANTFPWFYNFLMNSDVLPFVNFVNKWGLFLLGISFVLGIFIRFSSVLGAILMLLYYFPVCKFPYVGDYNFVIDEHIIYILLFVLFYFSSKDLYFSLDNKIKIWKNKI